MSGDLRKRLKPNARRRRHVKKKCAEMKNFLHKVQRESKPEKDLHEQFKHAASGHFLEKLESHLHSGSECSFEQHSTFVEVLKMKQIFYYFLLKSLIFFFCFLSF